MSGSDFIFSNARVKAKEVRLLNDSQIARLSEQESLEEFLSTKEAQEHELDSAEMIESSESQQALDSVNKGFANKGAVCAKFELEAVRLLRTHTPFNADLHFEYRCSECKEIFPLESHRCPTCNALLSFEVLCSVRESRNEARYSLL